MLINFNIIKISGYASNSPIRPSPTTTTIADNPIPTPNQWGMVRFTPKFAPDAISIRLFGPGVIEETKQKVAKAIKISYVI